MEARLPEMTVPTPWRPVGVRPGRGRAAALGLLVLSVVAGILLLPASVHAAVASTPNFYVDKANPSCSDGGSGTFLIPFCTIGAGASHLGPAVTVQVAAGTYTESVTVLNTQSGTSTDPAALTAVPGVTVTGGAHGFAVTGASYLTISGFTVTATTGDGISVIGSDHITIDSNHVMNAGTANVAGAERVGIRLQNSTNSVISSNVAELNSSMGIYLSLGSTGNQVIGNTVNNNAQVWRRAAAGIQLSGSPGNTVAKNISHDNEDSGIASFAGSNNNVVVNNVSYNNGDHGIDDSASTGMQILANTVYKNVAAGINVEGSSTGATIANNISVDNGIASPRTSGNIRVEASSIAGTTMDYDLVNLSAGTVLLNWNSVTYVTLSAFQAASGGQEAHGLFLDPTWSAPNSGDFHLSFGSPAIDSANSGATGQPSQDVLGNARFDVTCVTDTGAGSPTYADRGAYEYTGACAPHVVISPAPAAIAANGTQAFTAQAFDASNTSLGDVTGSTTFTISPNGSCTGSSCTATVSGQHTVTGSYSGQTATSTLTVFIGPLDHLVLTPATASISAGGSQSYSAQGFDPYNNSLGDVTLQTTFTISPNGSCTGSSCSATVAGTHTVTGTDSGKTGTATLTVTAGTLDHLVLTPATASISAGGPQSYSAQGFDASNNSLGDVTLQTTFTISPNGSCTGSSCSATVAGAHTVTGTDSGKTGTATLTVSAASGGGGGGGGSAGVPDLKASLSASTTIPPVGGESDLVATVTNSGTQASTGTHLVITLPATMTLLGPPAFDRGSGCTGSQSIDCNLDFLPVGVATKVIFAVRVNGTGTITAVASSDKESNPADNTASITLAPPPQTPGSPPPPVVTAPKLTQKPAGTTVLRASRSGRVATVGTLVGMDKKATVILTVRNPRTGKKLILLPGSRLATMTLKRQSLVVQTLVGAGRGFTLRELLPTRQLSRGAIYQLILTATGGNGKSSKLTIRFLG